MAVNINTVLRTVVAGQSGGAANIASSPNGKQAITILRQLAQSGFTGAPNAPGGPGATGGMAGQPGVFADLTAGVNVANPLKSFEAVAKDINAPVTTTGDFAKKIAGLMSGDRTVEGQQVTLPPLQERAQVAATSLAKLADQVKEGKFDQVIGQAVETKQTTAQTNAPANVAQRMTTAGTVATTTAFTAAATAARDTSKKGGIYADILANKDAMSEDLTDVQKKALDSVDDPKEKARLMTQFQLENHSELMQLLSSLFKLAHDTNASIAHNIA